MYHPPDIRLVNAHPKSDGGTYHFDPVVDEVVLCFVSLAGRQSGMVDAATDAVFLQHLCHCFSFTAAHAVNDSAFTPVAGNEVYDGFALLLGLVASFYRQAQVRAVE